MDMFTIRGWLFLVLLALVANGVLFYFQRRKQDAMDKKLDELLQNNIDLAQILLGKVKNPHV